MSIVEPRLLPQYTCTQIQLCCRFPAPCQIWVLSEVVRPMGLHQPPGDKRILRCYTLQFYDSSTISLSPFVLNSWSAYLHSFQHVISGCRFYFSIIITQCGSVGKMHIFLSSCEFAAMPVWYLHPETPVFHGLPWHFLSVRWHAEDER